MCNTLQRESTRCVLLCPPYVDKHKSVLTGYQFIVFSDTNVFASRQSPTRSNIEPYVENNILFAWVIVDARVPPKASQPLHSDRTLIESSQHYNTGKM